MTKGKNVHPQAGEHFGISFQAPMTDDVRIQLAYESLADIPLFLDLAGPGDRQLAADLLVQGTTQALVRALDFIMLALPSFNNPAAHALFAVEMAKMVSIQFEAASEAFAGSANRFVSNEISKMPEERQREILLASRDRALAHIQNLFGGATEGLFSGDKPERSN